MFPTTYRRESSWPGLCHRVRRQLNLAFLGLAGLFLCGDAAPAWSTEPAGEAPATAKVRFNSQIRPILSDRCFYCHGPDGKHREAGLRLDDPASATQDLGNGAAIVAGDPAASLLIRRVTETDEDLVMPPPTSKHGRLQAAEVDLLSRWIREGAEYEPHWAFAPLDRRPPPAVIQTEWAGNPIDRFVLAKLEASGIQPAPEADRATLIRRLSLDLTGLLPTPQRVREFEADPRSDAYERLVDELLASPYFGERWGRHWLDQARYADSNGYSIDAQRAMWPYRDWVIRAVQDDMPFDRFTIEQLAGDLLPQATKDQRVASAFHRNTLINQEGGTDAEQFRHESVVDRVNTTGAVWLGLTLGCAQCHTHKFDPISDREYYELFAFFNSGTDINSVGATVAVAEGEMLGVPQAPIDELRDQQRAEYETRLRDQLREQQRLVDAAPKTPDPTPWERLAWPAESDPQALQIDGDAKLESQPDGSLLVTGKPEPNATYRLRLAARDQPISAVRLRVLADDRLPDRGPGLASNGNFVLTDFQILVNGKVIRPKSAIADHAQQDYPIRGTLDGEPTTGWAINVGPGSKVRMNADHEATFFFDPPLAAMPAPAPDAAPPETWIELKHGLNKGYLIGRFSLDVSATAPQPPPPTPDPELLRAIELPLAERPNVDRKRVLDALAAAFPESKGLFVGLAESSVMVMQELPQPRQTFISIRGDFLRPDETTGPVRPGGLAAVSPSLAAEPQRSRLDLANWLVHPDNPLTPRVTINRVWMRYFGRGLVETEEDFGTQGTPPSHPELLDWLARSLQEGGWSMKSLHRQIVTSNTYRQSSRHREDLAEIDPSNRLLARQNRLRVEAEIVRDVALSASGQWHAVIGGESVHPPQPAGVYAFTQNVKKWDADTDGNRFRRAMYTEFFRSAPHPLFTTFDTPDFQTVCTRRNRSNTPLQALTVANDEAFVELARAMAARVLRELPDGDAAQRLEHAFRLGLSRQPSELESRILREHYQQLLADFGGPSGAEVAAWLANDPLFAHLPPRVAENPSTETSSAEASAAGADPADENAAPAVSSDPRTHAAALAAICRAIINTDNFITRE